MANMMEELKRGNHTLSLKVKKLEDSIEEKDDKIQSLSEENYRLKKQIASLKYSLEHPVTSQDSKVNTFFNMVNHSGLI